MMVLVILLVFISMCVSALCAFVGGLGLGAVSVLGRPENVAAEAQHEKKPPKTYSEEEIRQMQKRQREMQNFFNYNGDPLPKPDEEQIN